MIKLGKSKNKAKDKEGFDYKKLLSMQNVGNLMSNPQGFFKQLISDHGPSAEQEIVKFLEKHRELQLESGESDFHLLFQEMESKIFVSIVATDSIGAPVRLILREPLVEFLLSLFETAKENGGEDGKVTD
jgi:hypothetical protein